ncbi:MAG: outer membrane lipoprotein chaperone LolA [Candidatus Sedimenticola sp. (ex Thyasira tokunagai)]
MCSHFFYKLSAAAAALLFSISAIAANGVEQMNYFLTQVTSLQAGFEQTVLSADQQQAIRSQGNFYLQQPGKFRWDYTEPEPQQIIADGRQVWLVDPELEQVSVQSQRTALKGTPAMLLVSGEPVDNHFEVIDIGNSQGFAWVELIPKEEESQFTRILLAFSNNEMQRMEMADKFGQVTRFQFFDIEHNPQFKSRFFLYQPPLFFDRYSQ